MNKDDLKYNAEGYRDKTAETAIRAADKPPKSSYRPPYEVAEMVDMTLITESLSGTENPEQFTDNRKEKRNGSKRISKFSNENKRRKGNGSFIRLDKC